MTEAVPFGSGKAYPSSLVRAARATMKDVLAVKGDIVECDWSDEWDALG